MNTNRQQASVHSPHHWVAWSGLAILAVILAIGSLRHPHFWLTADQKGELLFHRKKYGAAAKTYLASWHIGVSQYRQGAFETAAKTFARVPGASGAYDQGNADEITYVLQTPGRFILPAVPLVWWDLDAKALQTVSLPARTFEVAANPALAVTKPGPVRAGWESLHLRWMFLGLLLGPARHCHSVATFPPTLHLGATPDFSPRSLAASQSPRPTAAAL